MTATSTRTPEQVLTAARDTAVALGDLQVLQLVQAVEWAELNPGDDLYDSEEWAMRPLELAGSGAPTIDESAVAEFALAIGMKHEPGARLIADALELCHRLPRVWARIVAGEVPVWKGRRIAEHTMTLSLAAATAVDAHLAIVARRCSFAEIQRQVEKARAERGRGPSPRRRRAAPPRHPPPPPKPGRAGAGRGTAGGRGRSRARGRDRRAGFDVRSAAAARRAPRHGRRHPRHRRC